VNNVLLTAGVACLILAVVGGGGKVLEVELPVIVTPSKLVVLALLGCVFLAGAYFTRNQPTSPQVTQPASPQGESQEVRDYRAAVAVTCANIVVPTTNALLVAGNDDGTHTGDRDRLQAALFSQLAVSQETMDQLWRRPLPKELADDARSARSVSDRYLEDTRARLDAMRTELPKKMSFQDLLQWADDFSAKIRSSGVQFQTEMSRLAGSPCTPPFGVAEDR
jgi:hypothetical protein